MRTPILKKITGICLAAAMAVSVNAGYIPEKQNVSAAGTSYHFDFGGNGTASGYTGVSASDGYNASRGYGFADTSKVKNVSASGSGAFSDAVQFTDTSLSNTFNVDLPNGLYRLNVTLGNTTRTTVAAEGMLQIINMTGNNATDSILIPITDGQLNIMATNGKAGYAHTISALDIEWVSADTQLPLTIWFCGDSTVCNYYPKATSTQAGWGQVFDQYVDSSKWQVRNMAASGQYAAGFVNAGQFAPILKYGKAGDIYIISIGINDTNYSNKDEYTQVVTSMVQQAKAKGMQVILVKQQGRKGDYSRNPLLTGRWFGTQLDAIGAAEGVQVIDLFNLFQDYCVSVGAATADTFFVDNLHPNRTGALKLAELVASQMDLSGTSSGSTVSGAEIDESITFTLKNGNSGLYLALAAAPSDGTNVVQAENTGITAGYATWRAISAGESYYKILNVIQLGDYLLVQFGINDGAYNKAERYAPTCGTVPGTDGSFEFYMAKYIEGALAKGAPPILISPTLSLKNRSGNSFVASYTNYTDSVKKLSAYYKVPYIDLNGLMVDHYNKIGYDTAYTYHMCVTGSSDMTHFTETGANAVAGLVANAIKGLNLDISGRVTS